MYPKIASLFLFLIINSIYAEDSLSYFLVYFKDKKSIEAQAPSSYLSSAALKRRAKWNIPIFEGDKPVSVEYIKQLAEIKNIRILKASKWLNAAEISSIGFLGLYDSIKKLPFVSEIVFLGRIRQRFPLKKEIIDSVYFQRAIALKTFKKEALSSKFDESYYNKSFNQNELIGIPDLHRSCGANSTMHIAVFDAGFHNAYKVKGMEDLLDSSVIIKDLVDNDNSVWEDDQHGCNVLGLLKTFDPNNFIGSAPFAKYTLIRTENSNIEAPIEEVNWVIAAEFADSLGVDLISASLGYHIFDDPSLSHTHAQLDGKTSIVARAANEAYLRGIVVISSVGNEAQGKWHLIGTPSDAAGVISIGACDEDGFYARFSSCGPSADGRIKPDFLAPGYKVTIASEHGFYASNGTSYSTPIFAGAFACLMQLFPDKSPEALRRVLLLTATHKNLPDSAYGFGLPDFALAKLILETSSIDSFMTDIFYLKSNAVLFQDLNIHFRSGISQTVHIVIKTPYKKKQRTIYKSNSKLSKGEWLHSDILMLLSQEKVKLKRKMIGDKTLILIFETENGSFQRTFELS